ncbi:MAG: hypothetical protein R2911_12115 [Caldilineaceae bacterium]
MAGHANFGDFALVRYSADDAAPTPTETTTGPTPTPTATPPASNSGILRNISTRGRVLTDANVMIGGFIIEKAPVKAVVRAYGPSMTALGLPDVLKNPVLKLYSGQNVIFENDDWQNNPCPTDAPADLWPTAMSLYCHRAKSWRLHRHCQRGQ